jgi:hypothetical protein
LICLTRSSLPLSADTSYSESLLHFVAISLRRSFLAWSVFCVAGEAAVAGDKFSSLRLSHPIVRRGQKTIDPLHTKGSTERDGFAACPYCHRTRLLRARGENLFARNVHPIGNRPKGRETLRSTDCIRERRVDRAPASERA